MAVAAVGSLQARKLISWNIQDGMWSDQANNYDNFVEFLKTTDPDICVFCEAKTTHLESGQEPYLPAGWENVAARYGHPYVYLALEQDNSPQVITSKHPINNVKRIAGNGSDTIVGHGAGWVQIEMDGLTYNIVCMHAMPFAMGGGGMGGFGGGRPSGSSGRSQGGAAPQGGTRPSGNGGSQSGNRPSGSGRPSGGFGGFGGMGGPGGGGGSDEFRKKEVEYVCKNTILTSEHPENELWLMMGDFNSISSLDNDHYKLSADSSIYCVHDYIRNNTPYIDVIANKHPGEFIQSSQNGRRIDFIYATEPVINMIRKAEILNSGYTEQHREQGAQYWTPSDHRPILIEF
jgi:endonuclease/exonuclease/phosphatase family metal-dependent hydrolase